MSFHVRSINYRRITWKEIRIGLRFLHEEIKKSPGFFSRDYTKRKDMQSGITDPVDG